MLALWSVCLVYFLKSAFLSFFTLTLISHQLQLQLQLGDFLLIANRKRFWFEDTSTVAAFLIVSKPIHFYVHLRTDWSQTTALICAPRTKIDFYIAVSMQHSSGAFTLTTFSFLLISKLSFVTIVQIYRLLKATTQCTESLCLFCLVWLNVL